MENTILVCIYKDTTGWYDDEYFDDWSHDNLIELDFPVPIVKRWWLKNDGPSGGTDFWTWYMWESNADDTDGLFSFAVKCGFTPKKPDNYLDL